MTKKTKDKAVLYAAIFVFAPGGTVIVPCLITRDLYLWLMDWHQQKRGHKRKRKPTPPAT